MTDRLPDDSDIQEAERRRDEALRRALNTPPQHKVKPRKESNPAPKRTNVTKRPNP